MMLPATVLLLIVVSVVVADDCNGPLGKNTCRDWHFGIDSVRPSGSVVHGHAKGTVYQSSASTVQGNVHGSHVFGGPHNGAQAVGGGLNYQHSNGLHGAVDATHSRHQGTTYTGTMGGQTQVGPGTLSVGVGASQHPGSSHMQGQVGATYTVPLP